MKKIILSILILGFLTGCPDQEEVNNMLEGLSEKKITAEHRMIRKDYTLESLLQMQDYFFDFTEKVHLIKSEPEAAKSLAYLIKKDGIESVCDSFVLPLSRWSALNKFCTVGSYYRCSPEMQNYKNTLDLFRKIAGIQNTSTEKCN